MAMNGWFVCVLVALALDVTLAINLNRYKLQTDQTSGTLRSLDSPTFKADRSRTNETEDPETAKAGATFRETDDKLDEQLKNEKTMNEDDFMLYFESFFFLITKRNLTDMERRLVIATCKNYPADEYARSDPDANPFGYYLIANRTLTFFHEVSNITEFDLDNEKLRKRWRKGLIGAEKYLLDEVLDPFGEHFWFLAVFMKFYLFERRYIMTGEDFIALLEANRRFKKLLAEKREAKCGKLSKEEIRTVLWKIAGDLHIGPVVAYTKEDLQNEELRENWNAKRHAAAQRLRKQGLNYQADRKDFRNMCFNFYLAVWEYVMTEKDLEIVDSEFEGYKKELERHKENGRKLEELEVQNILLSARNSLSELIFDDVDY